MAHWSEDWDRLMEVRAKISEGRREEFERRVAWEEEQARKGAVVTMLRCSDPEHEGPRWLLRKLFGKRQYMSKGGILRIYPAPYCKKCEARRARERKARAKAADPEGYKERRRQASLRNNRRRRGWQVEGGYRPPRQKGRKGRSEGLDGENGGVVPDSEVSDQDGGEMSPTSEATDNDAHRGED